MDDSESKWVNPELNNIVLELTHLGLESSNLHMDRNNSEKYIIIILMELIRKMYNLLNLWNYKFNIKTTFS